MLQIHSSSLAKHNEKLISFGVLSIVMHKSDMTMKTRPYTRPTGDGPRCLSRRATLHAQYATENKVCYECSSCLMLLGQHLFAKDARPQTIQSRCPRPHVFSILAVSCTHTHQAADSTCLCRGATTQSCSLRGLPSSDFPGFNDGQELLQVGDQPALEEASFLDVAPSCQQHDHRIDACQHQREPTTCITNPCLSAFLQQGR